MAEIPTLTGTFKALNTDGQRFLADGERRSRAQCIIDAAVSEASVELAITIDKSLKETACLGWGKLATPIDKVLAEAVGLGWGKGNNG